MEGVEKGETMIPQKKKRYITDQTGKRVGVVLDLRTFQKMEDELDDYYSKKAYEKAKKETDEEIRRGEFITLQELIPQRRERKGRHRNSKRR